MSDQYHVKVLLTGKKRYDFLKSNGTTTHLLIHANTWSEQGANRIATQIVVDNPEAVVAAKVVAA